VVADSEAVDKVEEPGLEQALAVDKGAALDAALAAVPDKVLERPTARASSSSRSSLHATLTSMLQRLTARACWLKPTV
jgi:hypothetical protein